MAKPVGARSSDNAKFVDHAYEVGLNTSDWLIYPKTVCEILNVSKEVFEDISKQSTFPKKYMRNGKRMYKTGDIELYASKNR